MAWTWLISLFLARFFEGLPLWRSTADLEMDTRNFNWVHGASQRMRRRAPKGAGTRAKPADTATVQRAFFASERYRKMTSRVPEADSLRHQRSIDVQSLMLTAPPGPSSLAVAIASREDPTKVTPTSDDMLSMPARSAPMVARTPGPVRVREHVVTEPMQAGHMHIEVGEEKTQVHFPLTN